MKLKSFLAVLVLLFTFVLAPLVKAQSTAWTVNSFYLDYQTKLFDGRISGTDTLTSNEFDIGNNNCVFGFYKSYTQTNDSIKISVLRQVRARSGEWITQKALLTSDSTKTLAVVADTCVAVPVKLRLIIYGTTGNGYKANFHYTIRAPAD